MRHLLLALLLVAIWPVSEALAARKWTDTQGKIVQGDFVRIHEGHVIIKKLSPGLARIPYWSLSETDREYVNKELEKIGQTGLIPPEPVKNSGSGSEAPGLPPGGGLGGPFAPGVGPDSGARPGFPPGGPGRPGFPGPIGGAGAPGAGPGFPGPIGGAAAPGSGPGYGGPGSGLPGAGAAGYTPPDSGASGYPSPPGYSPTPPGTSDLSPGGRSFGPGMPGGRLGGDPGSGYPGGSSNPGSVPGYTPPTMPEIPRFELKYKFNCPKCGHTWTGDSSIHIGPCPSCGGSRSSGSGGANLFPSSSPSPSPYSSPSSNPDAQAARQAGAIAFVVMMFACPVVIALVMIVAIIAIIFFVVKAVSAPAPVPVRRNY